MSEKKENQSEEDVKNQSKAEENLKSAEGAEDSPKTENGEKKEEVKTEKSELETALEKVDELTKENAELKDQYLRKVAEFDNYRKRTIQEKQDAYDYANTNLLKDLLDSLDNFDRALDSAANATDVKSVVDGVKMISKGLVSMLENKYNLVSYGKEGDAFNPDEHEAIGSEQGAVAEPVLKTVYLKGYKLKERVIRHAKVMVTMPDGSAETEQNK